MSQTARKRDPRVVALATLVGLAVLVGLALGLTGVGADLSEPRDVTITVYAEELLPDVAAMVEVGDVIYTDPGGMASGEIVDVERGPMVAEVPDSEGSLQAAEDPTQDAVTVVMRATGREGNGVVALENQVIQAGMQFIVITNDYMLKGLVTGVEFD